MEVIKRFSVYKFTDETDMTFNPTDYSMFKFGANSISRKFGNTLAKKFINSVNFQEILKNLNNNPEKRIVVLSSPYVYIPTATFAMKDYFIRTINDKLIELGQMPVIETKIYRRSSYNSDYGEMTKAQRFNVMKNDIFHVDKFIVENNICIYLDDIVITGAHEHRIQQMIKKYNINADNYFLYYAELINHETNPVIENYLNYHFVKNLNSIDWIIKNDEFKMNTRSVKYILNATTEDCKTFLLKQKQTFLYKLYSNAIGNNYHTLEAFKTNITLLKSMITK